MEEYLKQVVGIFLSSDENDNGFYDAPASAKEIMSIIKELMDWMMVYVESDIQDDEFVWKVSVETHVYEYFTTDELLDYWVNNIKK